MSVHDNIHFRLVNGCSGAREVTEAENNLSQMRTWASNLRIHVECTNHLSYQDQISVIHV